jgi:membrane protein YdbS with pleckstrin-like domain
VLFLVAGVFFPVWFVWLPLIAVLWLLVIVRYAVRRLGVHYKMTNQMFFHRRGILTRTIDRIEAIDIDDITWQQGLVERMVNVGSIIITSRDRTNPQFTLVGIEDVENVSRLIDKARRAERLRRGVLTVE